MNYPLVMCGDHAEFEAEWAGKDPKTRPDWPLPSFDARDWAEAFCGIASRLGYKDTEGKPIDEGWVIGWFANALMRGLDEGRARASGIAAPKADEREAVGPVGQEPDPEGETPEPLAAGRGR